MGNYFFVKEERARVTVVRVGELPMPMIRRKGRSLTSFPRPRLVDHRYREDSDEFNHAVQCHRIQTQQLVSGTEGWNRTPNNPT